jgi:hypothetical protein
VPLLRALRARADAEGVSLTVLCRTLLQDGFGRALPSESERIASVEEELREGLGDLGRHSLGSSAWPKGPSEPPHVHEGTADQPASCSVFSAATPGDEQGDEHRGEIRRRRSGAGIGRPAPLGVRSPGVRSRYLLSWPRMAPAGKTSLCTLT